MKRIMLFGLLAGVLAATTGCGLFQAVFCYRPCAMRGDCGPGCCGDGATRVAGRRAGRGAGRPRAGVRPRRARVYADCGDDCCPECGRPLQRTALPELRLVRRLLRRCLHGSLRRLLLRPAVAPWSAELPVRPVYARLLVRTGLRRALLGRFLLRPARLLGPVRLLRQLHGRRLPPLRRTAATRRLQRRLRDGRAGDAMPPSEENVVSQGDQVVGPAPRPPAQPHKAAKPYTQ